MPLQLHPVSIDEMPRQERTSKWRTMLEEFDASGQPSAQISFDGEVGRDDKPLGATSVASGLSTARGSSNGQFDHISVRTRGDAVYLVNKTVVNAQNGDEAEAESEQE